MPSYESDETAAIRQGKGRWGDPTLPRTGWRYTGMRDLGRAMVKCDLCAVAVIRFAHDLYHPALGLSLTAGCVCAGHLLPVTSAIAQNDAWLRSLASKRGGWLERKWRRSRQGNDHLKMDGQHVTVFKVAGGWNCIVAPVDNKEPGVTAARPASSKDAAKMMAFDLLVAVLMRHRSDPAMTASIRVSTPSMGSSSRSVPQPSATDWLKQAWSRLTSFGRRHKNTARSWS